MSTSETVVFEKCACPCGAGYIAQSVTSQNNPWSSADIDYAIECAHCHNEWRLDGSSLVLRSSESEYLAAKAKEEQVSQALHALMDRLVADYFVHFAAQTKKAEHAEMVHLGIATRTYEQYLKHRRNGGTAAKACYGMRNAAWLRSVAGGQSVDIELDRLIAANDSARQASTEAYKAVVRQSLG
jgi:hypothetical protein